MPKEAKEIKGPVRFVSPYNLLTIGMRHTWVEVQAGIPIVHPGKSIRFENGTYVTSDPEEIEFLRKHPLFGRDFFEAAPEVDKALSAAEGKS